MAKQTILFTVMPRGVSLVSATVPVSVYVSPRLYGDTEQAKLIEFKDWLLWTRRLKEDGLSLTFHCNGADFKAQVATDDLKPELWEAIFNADTLVRSHTFDDFTDHKIVSYSTRNALSLLKGLYQEASYKLALPDSIFYALSKGVIGLLDTVAENEPGIKADAAKAYMTATPGSIAEWGHAEWGHRFWFMKDGSEYGNHEKLKKLVNGFEVKWDEKMRDAYQAYNRESDGIYLKNADGNYTKGSRPYLRNLQSTLQTDPGKLDGVYQVSPSSSEFVDARKALAQEFTVAHHIPPGQPLPRKPLKDNPTYFDNLLDFHQVLSSLNSYPELLRALGLVIDFELPLEFAPITDTNGNNLSVKDATPKWEWRATTTITSLETRYGRIRSEDGTDSSLFLPLPNPEDSEAYGLLSLNPLDSKDPPRFGLAQVDVDGGMHKTIMLAETIKGDHPNPPQTPHPEVFDPRATLPSLRSGGFTLYADDRGDKLLRSFARSKDFQIDGGKQASKSLFAEDLVHGYRLDIWDSHTNQWHSLHRRDSVYTIEDQTFATTDTEGFTQLAAAQPADNLDKPPAKDLYVHESIARWAGWSLSVPFPGKVLSSEPDPKLALVQSSSKQNTPATPFKMTTQFSVVSGSLPSLRFGRRYRVRARVVDICGNSLALDKDKPILEELSEKKALPQDQEGFAYLRYEPVISPLVVLRDVKGITDPGSQVDRIVIRTYNCDPSLDNKAADLTANDRHILPPRVSVEMAERLGMLDDSTGKLNPSHAMYDLLAAKDGAELNSSGKILIAGNPEQEFPLEPAERIDSLPYIPDVLAKGAALRDLPGAPNYSIGNVKPGADPEKPIVYTPLDNPNPRPGSATLISFGGEGDWQTMLPFRLALSDGNVAPTWDALNRVLTVSLPKGSCSVVPLSSYIQPDDLKLMGIWQWLQEYIEQTKNGLIESNTIVSNILDLDIISNILQMAVEGGHWMLTPPRLLNLIHAVQQPLGIPEFTAIPVQHEPYDEAQLDPNILQTAPEIAVAIHSRNTISLVQSNPTELNAITAWRQFGSTDAYLLGGLHIHAASTARVDVLAEWDDPIDDPKVEQLQIKHHAAPVDEIPINLLINHPILVRPDNRPVGYYDAVHDLLCFVRNGDRLGNLGDSFENINYLAFQTKHGIQIPFDLDPTQTRLRPLAPLHRLNDTKHHSIRYTARSTTRYREYFPQFDLSLLSVAEINKIVEEKPNLVIVAFVEKELHIRIFDPNGKMAVDKAENELVIGYLLEKLKNELDPLPNVDSLPKDDKQKIIEDAFLISGYTPFSRSSTPYIVEVPASARPIAPQIAYVIPTFGWQRQTQTNLKRSVRFGGGLRVYLERPWFSSGDGELLGITFHPEIVEDYKDQAGQDSWKPFTTRWGNDPIWHTKNVTQLPLPYFPDAIANEFSLSLEEDAIKRVNVIGFPVAYDEERQKWYCDISFKAQFTYSPFVRLALVRYQPCALADAKLSRVVLADFAQLTNDRAAVVTADPYHPRQLKVTISGIKPTDPLPQVSPTPTSPVAAPTKIEVEIQQRDDTITGDLAWQPVADGLVTVNEETPLAVDSLVLWIGDVKFSQLVPPDKFRLLIREYEYISADYTVNPDGTLNPASDQGIDNRIVGTAPRRLVYAETIEIDAALISQPPSENRQTKVD